ncbi:glycosyltransferase family A protein [Variovorax sp. J22P271]|uniref:glycosyltransferase family A protein n=1 Tax=Variovorax davisae TaxID=3053515 RepID=UPI0025754527|nr:glycosyltransferase family A protein [Variovorax sp. J22P271]MDM0033293.1 glycosyltransferase family A protein [Variovorax sp. J22P271]
MTERSIGSPRFSVIIPTRNRPETLRHSLATCLNQDFEDYEILVCDNSDSVAAAQVAEIVAAAKSSRIRYLQPERPLAMSANWERGLSEAIGEYVTVLGDDDGLMPYALRELDRLASRTHARAMRWQRGIYTWPTIGIEREANLLIVTLSRTVAEIDGRAQIAKVMRFEDGTDSLPMIYCSAIHRDLIAQHRAATGRVFLNVYPDIYSGFGFGYLVGKYLSISTPMNIAGLSHASNGVATLMHEKKTAVANDFSTLNEAFGYRRHPLVPDKMILAPVHVVDSFLHAKDALFPRDDTLVLDRKAVTERYLGAILETDPKDRDEVRQIIRASVSDSAELLQWFDTEAPSFPPALPHTFRPRTLGFDGITLSLDAGPFGVENISDAVGLATSLLGVDRQEIAFDVPSLHDMRAQIEAERQNALRAEADATEVRRQAAADAAAADADLASMAADAQALREVSTQLELRLADAQRLGSLRYVPRRLVRKAISLLRKPSSVA